jgi:hypothetical protein
MAGKWVQIKSWKDLKIGMKVKSRLDMDHPMLREDDDDDGSHVWYQAEVVRIRDANNEDNEESYGDESRQIDVIRKDMGDNHWHTIITPDNLWAMKIWTIADWDD